MPFECQTIWIQSDQDCCCVGPDLSQTVYKDNISRQRVIYGNCSYLDCLYLIFNVDHTICHSPFTFMSQWTNKIWQVSLGYCDMNSYLNNKWYIWFEAWKGVMLEVCRWNGPEMLKCSFSAIPFVQNKNPGSSVASLQLGGTYQL